MKSYLTLLLTALCLTAGFSSFAQSATDTSAVVEEMDDEIAIVPEHHHPRYFSNALDAGILSAAAFEKPGMDRQLTYLRFSFIANIGFHFNYDFDEHFGMFTGLGIKNIGFTEKISDSTVKRRVYTIGVPIGFKIGNLAGRRYFLMGGGVDVTFNYKEKAKKGSDKHKMSEFFSDQTASVMPYLFAGFSIKPGVTFKAQFYPGNFFNTDYETENAAGTTYRPYRGYDARLLFLSLGLDIHYRKSEKPTNTPQ